MYYLSDIVCHQIHVEYPHWEMSFEHDPQLAVSTRYEMFQQAIAEDALVFGFHLPFPALGKLSRTDQGFRWHPVSE